MIVYLTHPKHGVHVAYSDDEVERCKLNGWTVRVDTPKPAPAPPAPPEPPPLPPDEPLPRRLPRRLPRFPKDEP